MNAINQLREAYKNKNLTLYLGAGASIDSGVPSWDALVLAMYFKVMSQEPLEGWRPFSNYLFAIAEWQLNHLREPLEISARKIRRHYHKAQGEFRKSLWKTLYEAFRTDSEEDLAVPTPETLREANPTLAGVVELCRPRPSGSVRSVVTYNYDALLEQALDSLPHRPIFAADSSATGPEIPIYHVHGYLPFESSEGSESEDIVFTEDQYNRVANDPYSWANLVQLHCMSSSVGLMVGLSLSDRNMRRLLDAVGSAPIKGQHFALLKRPSWEEPGDVELDKIHAKAMEYRERFERSGTKRPPGEKGSDWRVEIAGILGAVQNTGVQQDMDVFSELGIEPIWVDDYADIPAKLREIYDFEASLHLAR